MTLSHVTDGNALPQLVINPWIDEINNHETRLQAVEARGEVASQTFSTDLTSSGTTEVVGYSQTVNLVAGAKYRVYFQGQLNAAAAGNLGIVRVRYSTSALSTSSTLADFGQLRHGALGGPGQETLSFFADFIAPSTAAFNVGVGVATGSGGSGNESVQGSVHATVITVEKRT